MTKLHIGMKFHGHDSAIFIIDNKNKEIFGMSTERLTRYKHDDLLAIPTLKKYLEYIKIDEKKIIDLEISIPFTTHETEKYQINLYNYKIRIRNFLKAKYIKDFFIEFNKFKKQSFF